MENTHGRRRVLADGWSVLQDAYDLGEEIGIQEADWNPYVVVQGFSEWEPVERLGHLQPLLASEPYFGRELRHFNEHAWWYRNRFSVEEPNPRFAVLRFEGADYFARVWLNGTYLGEHEGYFEPFEFEVGHLLERTAPNHLVVKVWSPWDRAVAEGQKKRRAWAVVRDLVKGTYEHADTFVQRDVNPVGLWGEVSVVRHEGLRFGRPLQVDGTLAADGTSAGVTARCPVLSTVDVARADIRWAVFDCGTDIRVGEGRKEFTPTAEEVVIETDVPDPKIWQVWDRGEPALYRFEARLFLEDVQVDDGQARFGIRSVKLSRSGDGMTFLLNGERIFLRGTNYFPDVYVSEMCGQRYERDLDAVKRCGFNAVRVHVHVEKPEFYELCDERGILVIQDSDLNWVHPTDDTWRERALLVFGSMIRLLRGHPSIIGWICTNEPKGGMGGDLLTVSPGPQLFELAGRLDPSRPAIRGSGVQNDPHSGDSHNYTGSLDGEETHYTDVKEVTEKLNTEFGFDAPPVLARLKAAPGPYRRLKSLGDRVSDIQYYQYRLLKHFIEKYRLARHEPCSGYFQFMLIDLCPQSFYGVFDYWGVPKRGVRALEESNQPVGIFLACGENTASVWAVNDFRRSLSDIRAEWTVVDDRGGVVVRGEKTLVLSGDSLVKVADLPAASVIRPDRHARLVLRDDGGRVLARNSYERLFEHPPHPKGHSARMSHELGMRLYDA